MARFGSADEIALLDGLAGLEEVSLGDTPHNGRRRRSLDASFRASLSGGFGDAVSDACTRYGLSTGGTDIVLMTLDECGAFRVALEVLGKTPAQLEQYAKTEGAARLTDQVMTMLELPDRARPYVLAAARKLANYVVPSAPATAPKTYSIYGGGKVTGGKPAPSAGGGGGGGVVSKPKMSTGVKVAIGVGAAGAALLVLPRLLGR